MPKKTIAIASDHAGFELKNFLKKYLENQDYEVHDLGCHTTDAVDYPDYAKKMADEITQRKSEKGVLICGSGIGISIAANRFKSLRAALCCNEEMAQFARQHNDANVICLGARTIAQDSAIKALELFLTTEFEGGRHQIRVEKMS